MSRAGTPAQPVLFALVAFAILPSSVHAQSADPDAPGIYTYHGAVREQNLIAQARKEGALALYTSMATTESGSLSQAFEKKYGVKVQLWRALSENVLQRALTEARANHRTMDVVEQCAGSGPRARAGVAVTAVPRGSPGLGCARPSPLVQRSREPLGDRLQYRQYQTRGAAHEIGGICCANMEGPAFARGHGLRLDVRRDRRDGRGAWPGILSEACRAQAADAQGPRPRRAARGCGRIAGVPHAVQRERRFDQSQRRSHRLGSG